MFSLENTNGFTAEDINLLNAAVRELMTQGYDEQSACDRVNDNWQAEGNTVASLIA